MSLLLGIETSCDETAAAVLEVNDFGEQNILSNVIYSQTEHEQFGGVVPEVASRKHFEIIDYIVNRSLANVDKTALDAICVTDRPGLIGALLVGVSFAKAFAFALKKPLVPVNHIAGHIAANFLQHKHLKPPFICLVVSGGHSLVTLVTKKLEYTVLGTTKDDAAGEAFDKVARVLGLGYPGGPKISAAAQLGDPLSVKFPRSIFGLDFSFSGIKTAVINYVHKLEQRGECIDVNNIAASFQAAVTDVLVKAAIDAAQLHGVDVICLAGGVAANTCLRTQLKTAAYSKGIEVLYPPIELCGDNGAMIAAAGYFEFLKNNFAPLDLNAVARI